MGNVRTNGPRRVGRDPRKMHYLYQKWVNANSRCHRPGSAAYENYGHRDIAVYEPWRRDPELTDEENMERFSRYKEWIEENLGKPSGKKWSIDRVDNNGNYEPGNLQWATKKQQTYNRRNNPKLRMAVDENSPIFYAHKEMPLVEFAN